MGVRFLFNVTYLIPEIASKYQLENSQMESPPPCAVNAAHTQILPLDK